MYYDGIGRRKTATARVRLHSDGSGQLVVNGQPYQEYFGRDVDWNNLVMPLKLTQTEAQFDVTVLVEGGGITGQSEAVRMVSRVDRPWAAIGTRLAADMYECTVLRDDIEDSVENRTRFVFLAREAGPQDVDAAKAKSRIMQRILVNDAEIRHLAEPWLHDLDDTLAGRQKTLH